MSMRVHKAVEPANLTKRGAKALRSLLEDRPHDGIILPKYDGVYAQFKFDPVQETWQAWSRTGERMLSLETTDRLEALIVGGSRQIVYIGEAWAPGKTHAEINGAARRQSPQDELYFYMHDTYNGSLVEELGIDTIPFVDRLRRASYIVYPNAKNVVAKELGRTNPEVTFDTLLSYAGVTQESWAIYGNVLDGLILRDALAPFVPGSGTNGGNYKIKPRKSLDLLVVGEHEEMRDTKLGGYIVVEYKGVRTDVGSGLTQADLTLIHDAQARGSHHFVNRVAEVEFLDITKAGKLREPVLKAIRWDKNTYDV